MKKHGILNTLLTWVMDAKMKDSSELEKEISELKSKAEDEFEGGKEEKQEMLDSMESKLEEMKKKEADDQKAKDSKKAKDSETKESKEPKEAGADNEPEEKEKKNSQTADSAIAMDEKAIAKKASEMALEMMKENVQITALCEKVIGKLPESMLYDSIDNKINKTLKIAQKDTDYSNKSQDVKIAVLETLAMGKQPKVAPNYGAQYAADANVAKNTANPLLKMIKGVN